MGIDFQGPAWLLPNVVFLVLVFSLPHLSHSLTLSLFLFLSLSLYAFSASLVIKRGAESRCRLDNYIFHNVQITNDCCCGNLITLHLMKRQLRLHDRVLLYTHYCKGRVKDYQAILFIIYDNFPLFFLSPCRFFLCVNVICIGTSTRTY